MPMQSASRQQHGVAGAQPQVTRESRGQREILVWGHGIVGGNGDGMSSINQLLVVGAMETMHCL